MSKFGTSQMLQTTTGNTTFAPNGILQRKCACGTHTIADNKCHECQRGALQRKSSNSSEQMKVPPIVHDVLRSSGQPLDESTKTFFESRFAYDFSRVRVHTGVKASESAQSVNALAYTVGRDVVFGAGQYMLNTQAGRSLLAHELTHVVQSGNSPRGSNIKIGRADSVQEQAAEHNETMAQPVVGHSAANLLHRKKGGTRSGFVADVANFFTEVFTGKETEYKQAELKEYLQYLKDNNDIEDDFNSDNKARAVVKAEMFKTESLDIKILLIQEMMTSVVFDDDEKAILSILEFVNMDERLQIADKVTYPKLYSKFNGEELDRLYLLLPNLNNFHPRGEEDKVEHTFEQYIAKWEKENGQKLTDAERGILATGCIGLTAINLNTLESPKLNECYKDFESAWNSLRKMKSVNESVGVKTKLVLFSKRFWSAGKDYSSDKEGKVDMSKYGYEKKPRGNNKYYTNFDYALLDEATGKWWHADHCDSRFYYPFDCFDERGKPQGPMTVFESNLQYYSRDLNDFDSQVFCVGVMGDARETGKFKKQGLQLKL